MIKWSITVFAVLLLALLLFPLISAFTPFSSLTITAERYVHQGPNEVGAANIVTSVIITYRGLDTLGEVTVLFIASTGIGFILKKHSSQSNPLLVRSRELPPSEIIGTSAQVLIPAIVLFGVYIILFGHITPGGGFQGGVCIAAGFLYLLLADPSAKILHTILQAVESLAGVFYIALGVLGLVYGAGFLDSRILPPGSLGDIISAGTIPIVSTFIGLKVGAELTGMLIHLKSEGRGA